MSERNDLTVQQVIDLLTKVEDKSQRFDVTVWAPDGFNLDYDGYEITEMFNNYECTQPSCVSLSLTVIDHGEFAKD
jgi:hypothetical protein